MKASPHRGRRDCRINRTAAPPRVRRAPPVARQAGASPARSPPRRVRAAKNPGRRTRAAGLLRQAARADGFASAIGLERMGQRRGRNARPLAAHAKQAREQRAQEQVRANDRRSGVARQAKHAAGRREPNQVGLPGRTATLSTCTSTPNARARRARDRADQLKRRRSARADRMRQRGGCGGAMASSSSGRRRPRGLPAPLFDQSANGKRAGIHTPGRVSPRRQASQLHRRWRTPSCAGGASPAAWRFRRSPPARRRSDRACGRARAAGRRGENRRRAGERGGPAHLRAKQTVASRAWRPPGSARRRRPRASARRWKCARPRPAQARAQRRGPPRLRRPG